MLGRVPAPFEVDLAAIMALPEGEREEEFARAAVLKRVLDENPLWRYLPHEGELQWKREQWERLCLERGPGVAVPAHLRVTGFEQRGQKAFHEISAPVGAFVAGNRSGKSHCGVVDNAIQTLPPGFLPPWLLPYKRWGFDGEVFVRIIGPDLANWLAKVMLPKIRRLLPAAALWRGAFDRAYNDRERRLRFADGSWWDFLCFRGGQRALLPDGVWKRVDQLQAGEMVQTRHGPRRVVRSVSYSEGPLLKVTTRGGAEIVSTPNHPHMTAGGDWVRTDMLEVGDVLDVRIGDTGGVAALEEWELGWMAVLIGDGLISGSQRTVQFSVDGRSPLLDELPPLPEGYRVRWRISKQSGDCETGYLVKPGRGPGNLVNQMLRKHGLWGCRAHDKFIPDAVFREPLERRARFLRWLWATDGTVAEGQKVRAHYTTCSERLAHDVKFLLWSLGLRAAVVEFTAKVGGFRKRESTMFLVRISASQIGDFCQLVGRAGQDFSHLVNGPRARREERSSGRIRSIEFVGVEPVYCVEVEDVHELIVEGVVTSNTHDMELDAFSGADLDRAHFDEEPEGEPGRARYEETLGRLVDRDGEVRWTLTPLLGLSFAYYELTLDDRPRCDEEVVVVTGDIDHNPHLSEQGRARFLRRFEKDPLKLKARKSGSWVHFAGLIYDEWRDDVHVVADRELPRASTPAGPGGLLVPVYAAIDPGINQDHQMALVMAFVEELEDGRDRIEVFHTYKFANGVVEDMANHFHAVCARLGSQTRWNVIDPSAQNRSPQTGRSIQWEFQRHGVHTILGQNARVAGFNAVKERLAPKDAQGNALAPTLVVQASCMDLIDEIRTYRWKKPRGQRQDAPRAEPIKVNDDLLDALRYLVMSLPQKAHGLQEGELDDSLPARAFRENVRRLGRGRRARVGGVF